MRYGDGGDSCVMGLSRGQRQAQLAGKNTGARVVHRTAGIVLERRTRGVDAMRGVGESLAEELSPGATEFRCGTLEQGDRTDAALQRGFVRVGQREARRQFHAAVVPAALGWRG